VTPVHARKMAARMEAQGQRCVVSTRIPMAAIAAGPPITNSPPRCGALSFVYLARQLGLKA